MQKYGNDPNAVHLNTKFIQILVRYSNRILWSGFQIPLNTESFNKRTTLNIRILDYSNNLKNRQVWYSNVPKMSGCQMFRLSNGGLRTGQRMSVLWQKFPVSEWSPWSRDQIIWKPDHKVFEKSIVWISGVWFSDGYCSLLFACSM